MEEGGAARYWLDRLFTAEPLGVRLPADPQKMFVRSLVLQNSRFPTLALPSIHSTSIHPETHQ